MKQPSSGQLLLARLASEYRAAPGLWQRGGSSLNPGKRCCIDDGLRIFAKEYGGPLALCDARTRLCNKLNCQPNPAVIWAYNDAEGRTVDHVIALLDSAAGITMTREVALEKILASAELELA